VEFLEELAECRIIRAEVVTPLTDAMRLVHHESGEHLTSVKTLEYIPEARGSSDLKSPTR
jgi:hypothetical protein